MSCYENKCDGSFIKMPSQKVSEMAKSTLVWIKEYREKRTKTYINNARQEIMNGWWYRFIKRSILTDEEVLAIIHKNPFNGFAFIPIAYDKLEDAAKRLLNACHHTDEIYISTEDLQRIS
jgi:hypothetical protein